MPTTEDVSSWRGQDLHGPDGKIGEITDVYLDRQTERPEWLAVRTGVFGTNVSFVPVHEASTGAGGVTVPYDKGTVEGAPNSEAGGELSPTEERRLYEYYGLGEDASGRRPATR